MIDENTFRQAETRIKQQRVDGIVARLIPSPWIAPGTPQMVLERWVHDLVGQHPSQSCCVERIDEFGVKVKRHAIGRHGWNRPALVPFQAKQE
jgi:hypothetical protein